MTMMLQDSQQSPLGALHSASVGKTAKVLAGAHPGGSLYSLLLSRELSPEEARNRFLQQAHTQLILAGPINRLHPAAEATHVHRWLSVKDKAAPRAKAPPTARLSPCCTTTSSTAGLATLAPATPSPLLLPLNKPNSPCLRIQPTLRALQRST